MEKIKDILPDIIDRLQTRNEDVYARIHRAWQTIPNKNIKEHASVVGLENGQLIIHVDSPSWLFELNMQRQKLEEYLAREVPQISKIHFKIGKVK